MGKANPDVAGSTTLHCWARAGHEQLDEILHLGFPGPASSKERFPLVPESRLVQPGKRPVS